MYAHLFLPLLTHNIRILALDRRGFGKSEYTGCTPPKNFEITYDTFATDTAALIQQLSAHENGDLGAFAFVGASMACGETLLVHSLLPETLREKCKGFVWIGPSLPFPLATPANPTAPPRELWDAILAGLRDDRYAFTRTAIPGIFGHGVIDGVAVDEETLRAFEGMVAAADPVAIERCIGIITARDLTAEIGRLAGGIGQGGGKMRMLILHGDSDQSMLTYSVWKERRGCWLTGSCRHAV